MIVLTDGVPNVALNYDKNYYSDDVISKTKSKLQQLKQSNVNVITMLTGIDDETYFITYYISSSMYSNLLYLETLSVLQGAPVFIWPAFTPTAISAIVVSSVSPDLCDITVLYPFCFAFCIVYKVSVNVPI